MRGEGILESSVSWKATTTRNAQPIIANDHLSSRVLGHGCFDRLFIYLVLIPVSCFVVFFSVLFRLQLSVVRPNRSQVVRIELPCISVS